jgi:hypothetical protein
MNELARSPDLYPQKLDLVRESAMVVALNLQAYRTASFLDDRLLTPAMRPAWLPLAELAAAARVIANERPLHFIFHAGHVGSTLLSRVLDETGSVLSLREPLPLRTLADVSDHLGAAESLLSVPQFDALLDTFLRLWSRGYPQTQSVVVKATSTAARLGPRLLAAAPEARAVYLNLAPEPYLATLLAGPNAVFDLRGFGAERVRRLQRLTGETTIVLHTLSPGKLAAMAWLTERLTQETITAAAGRRLLNLDFEDFLARRPDAIAQVLRHLGLNAEPHTATRLANSAVFSRYSKAPEQYGYGDALRAQALAQARRDHVAEIAAGLAWLERLGANNAVIAAVL